jgi:precorrin-2/cobalt-factor-2 C20-methyltransferase
MLGRVIGVGVGPGALDLLTLRAKSCIETSDVVVCPRASIYSQSLAQRIVQPLLDVCGKQARALTFPMTKDPVIVAKAVREAVTVIADLARQGRTVAFLSEGDPSTYSSFIYVRRALVRDFPQICVEIIPGVSSVMAVPAVAGLDLADGHERVAIVPSTYGIADLAQLVANFDTVVLMKVGREVGDIVAILAAQNLLEHAFFVSKATMPEQRVIDDLRNVGAHHGDCQSTIVIRKPGGAGRLLGEAAIRPRELEVIG